MILILTVLIVALDQATKYVVSNWPGELPQEIIRGVFAINIVLNKGGAFGILKNQVPFFILIAILAILAMVLMLRSLKKKKNTEGQNAFFHISMLETALSLVLGGTIGNLIDRLRFGYVIDFFDFKIWPVFNIADSAITIGMAMLLFLMFFKKHDLRIS